MRIPEQIFDPVPVIALLVVFALSMVVAYELGFRIGRWWQGRSSDEREGPTGFLVGSLLALMSFLLAITMGMAADRYDTRRSLVLEEANAIGTAYLRAGVMAEPFGEQARELLREYVPLRIGTDELASRPDELEEVFARSVQIQNELWAVVQVLARDHDTPLTASFMASINDVIDLHETRITANIYARVPQSVLLLLLAGSTLTLGLVGYSAGLTGKRSFVTAFALIVVLSAVTMLVLDIDRPRDGIVRVNQQPMIDLRNQLLPPDG